MKPWKSEKYLKWVRNRPCAVCGNPESEPHHLRLGFAGIGQKSSDCLCVPLCRVHHDEFHQHPDYEYQLTLLARIIDKAFREGLFRLT